MFVFILRVVSSFYRRHPDSSVPLFRGTDWFDVWYTSRHLEYGMYGELFEADFDHWQCEGSSVKLQDYTKTLY